ncbi:MAG: ABC transporter permease [Clostridiaceae bacterium]|nr:ABC transporter permease [Clostridiaceae bacterium]
MTIDMITTHLLLVFFSVLLTIIFGVPLGVVAYIFPKARKIILKVVEVLQTVPALALLGVIMVFLGPDRATVIIGLFAYSLLPVVLNTYTGLVEVDPAVKEAAKGIGMTKINRLFLVELPLALPLIFSGVRLAIVTSVGVAVFGAFVGGGGLGSVIYESIRVSNMKLLLQSTAVLIVMAVGFDFVMSKIEKQMNKKLTGNSVD